ncbi:copper-binding protein [Dickeya zeae]|uniref:copper-binding protein n=1 Tax=Dickeya zeae TaxID=204042 RepID=UPI00039C3938|nr:copper-binding protein [Dickeya zeae]MCO7262714.1 copper-binding protein [Dickeya zeae]
MRTLSISIAALLFSAPLLAEQPQSMTGEMNGMSHSMTGSMQHSDMQHNNMAMSPAPTESATVYQATGIVKQWNADSVTLAHDAIPALRWPAMTMTFRLPANDNPTPLQPGSSVRFSFVQRADGYTLTDIKPQQN